MEKQLLLRILSAFFGLRYPVRNAHAPYMACSALQYFYALSHKLQDFRENVIEHKMCGVIFSPTSV